MSPLPGASRAQIAFAIFGKGMVLQSQKKLDAAKEQFLASMKAFPDGSWHDESLYRLATIAQDEAEGVLTSTSKDNAKPFTLQELEAQTRAVQERLAALHNARSNALPYWQELIKRYPKSSRCEQAFYNAGVLLNKMAEPSGTDVNGRSEQIRTDAAGMLIRLCEIYPNGPCTGEALLILGQYSLEHRVDIESSQNYLTRLDAWIKEARKNDRVFSPPPPTITSQFSHEHTGEDGQIVQLSGGKVAFRPNYSAEALARCYLTKWYLDSTELQCAKLLGFVYFANEQNERAREQYAKIVELDALAKKIEASGNWSDYSRLKWGLDHGYLFAYPEELKRYDTRQRLAVLLADFYYVTQRFDDAAALAQRLLKSDFGPLKGAALEYPQYLYAACVYWTRGRAEALEEYMKVVGSTSEPIDLKTISSTRERAAYAAGNISLEMSDGPHRAQGKQLLYQIAFSGKTSQYAYQARIAYAAALINEGNRDEGIRLLETFSEADGDWHGVALSYIKAYHEAEHNSRHH